MSKPVYLLVIIQEYTEAWHPLSEDQKKSLWSQVQAVDERAGANYSEYYDSRWADEETRAFTITEYPNMDAYQTKVEELEKLNWWRYFKGKTLLGTKRPARSMETE